MDNEKMTDYLLKQSRKKEEDLKYDFMPSMLEIIERPAHKAGSIIILTFFSLLLIAIIWAGNSKIDIITAANGSIQPAGNLNVIKAYSNSTVKAIYIREGEYVKKGDILIELDMDSIKVNEKKLLKQKKVCQVKQKLYDKIGKEDISKVKVESYEKELKPCVQTILDEDSSYQNTIQSLKREESNADINRKIAKIQLEEYKENGTKRQVKSQKLILKQYELEKKQTNDKIKDAKLQYSAKVNSNLVEIKQELEEINSNIEQYKLSKKFQKITAPVNGCINTISVNTIGQVVSGSEELVTIVPGSASLEMVCYVKNMDIADIHIGTETEIKLEAYPYNKYNTVKGKVKYISPSAFVNEQMGSVYLVKIEIVEKPEGIDLISGLTGSAEMKIGKRSILEYFLEPIKKGFGDSLKEK